MISFHSAYQWLNQFDRSYLTGATHAIAAQLAGNFRPFTRDGVLRWMQRLTEVSASFGADEEMAESYVVCANAAYRINLLRDAADYLKAAIPLYNGHFHQTAVVKWLLGSIYWSRASQPEGRAALMLYHEAIDQFERLQFMYQAQLDRRAGWYNQRLVEMRDTAAARARNLGLRQSLIPAAPAPAEEETTSEGVPSSAGSPDDWQPEFEPDERSSGMHPEMPPVSAEAPPAESGAQSFPAPDLYSLLFQTFPISDSIPAGGYGPLGYDPNPTGYMQIDRVVIDDRSYRIRGLKRNGNLIPLTGYLRAGKQLTLLKVKGDSMNLLVQDGEYVLIALQNDASDGDIVVAGFVGDETEATLKRYYRRGNQVALEPVSDNPIHQPRIIDASQAGFKIIGVALAALSLVES